jgi:hypothetical protein
MKVRHRGIERKPALASSNSTVAISLANHARIPIGVSAVVPLTTYSSLKSYAQLHLILSAFDPDIATEVEATSNPAHLEREDCTLVVWYRSLYAPRTGGAYDSHHRTAGIAGCTRRRGGVAARGATAMPVAGFLSGAYEETNRGFDRLPWRRWASIGAWVVSAHGVSCFEVFSWQCGVSCNG